MTSRRNWPKPDLLQQRRLELGLPLEPAPAPLLRFLVLKGGIAAVVLLMLSLLTLLVLSIVKRLCRPRSMYFIPWRKVLVMPKHGFAP